VILSKRLSFLSLPYDLPRIPALKLIRGRMVLFHGHHHLELGMKTRERGAVKLCGWRTVISPMIPRPASILRCAIRPNF